MKITLFTTIMIMLTGLPLHAAIDAREELDSVMLNQGAHTTFQTAPEIIPMSTGRAENGIHVPLLYLDRDISIMARMQWLPQNYQMTMKQVSMYYPVNQQLRMSGKSVHLDDRTSDRSGSAVSIGLHQRLPGFGLPVESETFVQTIHADRHINDGLPSSTLFSVGAQGTAALFDMDINARLAYEEQLVASIASSTAVTASIHSAMPLHRFFDNTEFRLQWDYAEARTITDELQALYTEGQPKGELYAPNVSNISILNLSIACAPASNMFMSVEYYQYLQDQVQIESFSNNSSTFSAPEYTTGRSHDLGQELNLKARYAHSESLVSQLFAGWFEPGDAYGQADDKTYEIRGEIIVNF